MAVAEQPADSSESRRPKPDAEQTVAIRTRALTKRYGDFTAVDSLDLTVRQGEVFGLLGPNGAGKTTTILMLLGLSEPSDGVARVLGLDSARDPRAGKRRGGYLPDAVGCYGGLTGRENLRYTARLNAIPTVRAEKSIDRLLDQVGLTDAADHKVDTYSRGMKQRLGLADVLVKEPLVAILDEPTTSIDPTGVAEVLHLIRELADDGMAVLLSSHLLHQVQQICDRVAIFVGGKVVAQGAPNQLAEQSRGPMVLEISTMASIAAARTVVTGVSGVTSAEPDPRDPRVLVVTVDRDVRADVARALTSAGQPPVLLRRQGDELDEVYRRYFEGAA